MLQHLKGVVGPDKETILFDPQAHSYVLLYFIIIPLISTSFLELRKIPDFGMVVSKKFLNGRNRTSANHFVKT